MTHESDEMAVKLAAASNGLARKFRLAEALFVMDTVPMTSEERLDAADRQAAAANILTGMAAELNRSAGMLDALALVAGGTE